MFDSILFVQLGSPASALPEDVEQYLIDFLGDPHTLGNPPFFWKWLLKGIIAPRRAEKSAAKYLEMIEASGFSEMPLIVHTRNFAKGISAAVGPKIPVRFAFEFGSKPSIFEALQELSDLGCENVRIVPLFPQRSLVTTVAVHDLTFAALKKFPNLRGEFIDGFAMNSVWLEALLQKILSLWDKKSPVVLSFHGTPEKWIKNGDPYLGECTAEWNWLSERLGKISPDARVLMSFQSRLGPVKWLGPNVSDVVENLGAEGSDVLIVCPSFTADNLETLHEIDVDLRKKFLAAGGKNFVRVPCLNADAAWIEAFAREVIRPDFGKSP